jgi:hypothetical protein
VGPSSAVGPTTCGEPVSQRCRRRAAGRVATCPTSRMTEHSKISSVPDWAHCSGRPARPRGYFSALAARRRLSGVDHQCIQTPGYLWTSLGLRRSANEANRQVHS